MTRGSSIYKCALGCVLMYVHCRTTSTSFIRDKTAELSQRRPRDAPNIWSLNISRVWLRPRLLFQKFVMGFVPIDTKNVRTKFEVCSFTRSWDNRGYRKKLFGSPWIHPRSLFSQIFKGLLFAWTLWKHLPNLKFVALPIPEIIPDRYCTIHQRTRSGTSRVQARPSSGRAWSRNLGDRDGRVDLIGFTATVDCVYKILSGTFHAHHAAAPGLMDIDIDGLFTFNPSTHTRGHPYKLYKARCAKTVRQNFFACRIINAWNSLPTTVCFNSLASFKHSLKNVDLSSYLKCY